MTEPRLPSLIALRAFEAVARLGSMKQASSELHVTPGAVSQLVKKLEDELDVRLFERKNRELQLTREGIKLREGAFGAFNTLKKTICDLPEQKVTRSFAIACESVIARNWLAPRLGNIARLYSDVDLTIDTYHDLSCRDHGVLSNHGYDVVISTQPVNNQCLDFTCMGSESFTVLGAPSYVEKYSSHTSTSVNQTTLLNVQLDANLSLPTWDDWFSETGIAPCRDCQEINFGGEFEQALTAAKSGVGLLLAPVSLVANELLTGNLVCPFTQVLKSNMYYWLGKSKNTRSTAFVAELISWLEAELRQSIQLPQNIRELSSYTGRIAPLLGNVYAFDGRAKKQGRHQINLS